MPKISAPTVKEHHENVFEKLVNAAEGILRSNGGGTLTAAAVAQQAGIARNSIYRYVKSVDELRFHVLDRYLPIWTAAVNAHLEKDSSPHEQILTIAYESVAMAQTTGHAWLINVMRSSHAPRRGPDERPKQHGIPVTPAIREFHEALAGRILMLYMQINPDSAPINAGLTLNLIETSMKLIDKGAQASSVQSSLRGALTGIFNSASTAPRRADHA